MQRKIGKSVDQRYRVIRQIGEGFFSEVFLVEDQRSNMHYAMKVLSDKQILAHNFSSVQNKQFEVEFRKEVKILRSLSHPHIIRIFKSSIDDEVPTIYEGSRPNSGEQKRLSYRSDGSGDDQQEQSSSRFTNEYQKFMMLEFAENGDLFDYLISTNEPFPEDIARFLFLQLVSAVEYLHVEQKVVHRDLKLENVLVDNSFNLKVCDFSLAKTYQEGSLVGVFYSHVGTERYMAPEIIEGKPYKGNTTDIFALGVILFVMVFGVMPFQQKASISDGLYQFIYKNDEKGYWEQLQKLYQNQQSFQNYNLVSEDFKKFIFQFFSYHYFERISLEKIKGNKWIQNGELPAKEVFQKEMLRRKGFLEERFRNSSQLSQQRSKAQRAIVDGV